MKHITVAIGLALTLLASPAAAQTRISLAVGLGVPQPFVAGVVVVGRPYYYYPAPAVIVVRPRPYFHRRAVVLVRRVYVVRHHRHHHWDYDDD